MIRPLLPLDAALYRDIRLEGLRLHPEAFGASYEDEVQLTEAEFAARIPPHRPMPFSGLSLPMRWLA